MVVTVGGASDVVWLDVAQHREHAARSRALRVQQHALADQTRALLERLRQPEVPPRPDDPLNGMERLVRLQRVLLWVTRVLMLVILVLAGRERRLSHSLDAAHISEFVRHTQQR